MIRNADPADAGRIAEIYNPYVLNTTITFEENMVEVKEMRSRIEQVVEKGHPWLVMEKDNNVVGYAYASTWRERPAYRFSLESTIYLDQQSGGKGWGTELYTALLEKLQQAGVHAVIGSIALPNPESIRLHEKLGFIKVAQFPEVGFKFNRWIDVGFWQLTLKNCVALSF
jgi:phosphinothricin acetyltransferase